MRILGEIQKRDIIEDKNGRVHFIGDADIDADGANGQFKGKVAYRPDNSGLENLKNAKTNSGKWVGIVTDDLGVPYIQKNSDPAPGAYVSSTSLKLFGKDGKPLHKSNPYKYVDSDTVPFIVVPPLIAKKTKGKVLGCKARVKNTKNGMVCDAIVADIGPSDKVGEISMACARLLGINPNPRIGGSKEFIFEYELWPGVEMEIDGVKYPLQSYGS